MFLGLAISSVSQGCFGRIAGPASVCFPPVADISKTVQVLAMKWKPSIDDDMRSRFRRRSVEFVGFAIIYLAGSALLDFRKGEPWETEPFVLVAYAAGALTYVLLTRTEKSADQRV